MCNEMKDLLFNIVTLLDLSNENELYLKGYLDAMFHSSKNNIILEEFSNPFLIRLRTILCEEGKIKYE